MLQQAFTNPKPPAAVVILLCLSLFFPFLGARDFWENESQYAEVIRIMLLDGDYLLPKVNDFFFTASPPLFFWMGAFLSWLAGGVGEWTVRLPSALSATELVLLVYVFIRRRFDSRLAFFSAVVLAASVLTVHVERHIPVNSLFYLLIAAAMFFAMELVVFDSERRSHAYGAWLCMALACLTNGPLGLFFPFVVVGIYLALSRRRARVASLRVFPGALIFLVVTAPWFVYLVWTGTVDWLESILVHLRFTGHRGPDHQIFFSFPLAFAPWCLLFIPAAIGLWRDKSRFWHPPALYFFIWFAVGLFFSEVSFGKHNHYLFLAYIPVAVAVGHYLVKIAATERSDAVWVWTNYSVNISCLLFLLLGVGLPVVMWYRWPFIAPSVAICSVVMSSVAVAIVYGWKRHGNLGLLAGYAAYSLLANLLLQSVIFPELNKRKLRPLAEKVGMALAANPGSQLVIFNHRIAHEFNYYSRIKKIEFLDLGSAGAILDQPGRQFVLLKSKDMVRVARLPLRDPQVVFHGAVGVEPWVLMFSCKEDCDRVPSKAQTFDESLGIAADSGRHHSQENLIPGR